MRRPRPGEILVLWVLAFALAGREAAAQIDLTGRWHLVMADGNFGASYERALTLTQSGTTLTASAPYFGGTIDPMTGAFHLDGSGTCFDIFSGTTTVIPWTIDATASAAGAFTGTFAESIQPTLSCLPLAGTVTGTRLPDTCGDGVVDAGEICDGGLAGDACCTEFCTPRPAGTACPAAGNDCSTSACDGAGTCAHTPKPAGTLCRLAEGPCDTAEHCDGVATVCPPPFTPTEPDVDGDGVLDPCDDCVGQPIDVQLLRLGRFGVGSSARDVVVLKARVRLAPGATLPDASTTWKLVAVRDAGGTPVVYAQVPSGSWDPGSRTGWRLHGTRWTFRSPEPVSGAVSKMWLAPRPGDPDVYDVRVAARRATLADTPPVLPLDLELILDGLGPSTRCGERRLSAPGGPAPSCRALTRGGVLTCR